MRVLRGTILLLVLAAILLVLTALGALGATESEPNNNPGTADPLTEGQATFGMTSMGDDDYFTFSAGQGKIINISISGGQICQMLTSSLQVVPWRSTGHGLVYYTANETPSSTKWYLHEYMRIFPPNQAFYTITLHLDNQTDLNIYGDAAADYTTARDLGHAGSISGTGAVADLDTADYYKFTAGTGDIIDLNFSSDSSTGLSLTLLSEAKVEILTMSSAGKQVVTDEYCTAFETPDPTWYLTVEMGTSNGSYALAITLMQQNDLGIAGDAAGTTTNARDLDPPNSLSGNGMLVDLDTKDCYRFTAGGGDIISVQFQSDSTTDLSLALLGTDETTLFDLKSKSGQTASDMYYTDQLTPDCLWYLVVEMGTSRGNYSITVTIQQQDDLGNGGDAAGELASACDLDPPNNQNGDGTMADLDIKDCYKFTAGGGVVLHVLFTAQNSTDMTLTFLNAAEDQLFVIKSNAGHESHGKYLTANETPDVLWYIVVERGDASGEYSITVGFGWQSDAGVHRQDAPADNKSAIAVTIGPFTGWLGNLDRTDFYSIQVRSHDTVVINLTNDGPAKLRLILYDEQMGDVLNFLVDPNASDIRSADVTSDLATGDRWYLNISSLSDPETGYHVNISIEDRYPPEIVHTTPTLWIVGTAQRLEVSAVDNTAVAEVAVFYRVTGVTTYTKLQMVKEGDSLWNATVPASAVTSAGLEYYIWATDGTNEATFPAGGAADPIAVDVRPPDDEPPVIAHTTPASWVTGSAMAIIATITDNTDVISAKVFYRAKGVAGFSEVGMLEGPGDVWTAKIPPTAVAPPGVEYYIWASDGTNEATFPAGGASAPISVTDIAEADHAPPTIVHTTPTPWVAGSQREIRASITDNNEVSQAILFYRTKGGSTFSELGMERLDGDLYRAEIPGTDITSAGVEYYIWATDGANEATFPAGGASAPISVTDIAEPDHVPPTIAHTTPSPWVKDKARVISATITDNLQVTSASLFYRKTGAPKYTRVEMVKGSGDLWSAEIPAAAVTTAGVEYYLWASDGANEVTFPSGGASGPIAITDILASDTVPPVIEHTASTPWLVGVGMVVRANVTDDVGVASAKLYYRVTGASSFVEVDMTKEDGNLWGALFPAASVTIAGVEYYIWASDGQNEVTYPAGGATSPVSVEVRLADSTGPVIEHTTPTGLKAGKAITIVATVSDYSGVESVTLHYRAGTSGDFQTIDMVLGAGTWSATVPKDAVKAGTFQYYITSEDSLGNSAMWGEGTFPKSVDIAGEGKEGISGLVLALVLVLVVVLVLVLVIVARRRGHAPAPAVTPPPSAGAPTVAPGAAPAVGGVAVTAQPPPAPEVAAVPPPAAKGGFRKLEVNTFCEACGGKLEHNTNAYVCSCGAVLHEGCAGRLGICPLCKSSLR